MGEPAIVSVDGEVDFLERDALREKFEPLATAGTAIVDLSTATYFDSAALSELVRVQRRRTQSGLSVTRLVTSAPMRRILEVTGLMEVFQVFDAVSEAVRDQ